MTAPTDPIARLEAELSDLARHRLQAQTLLATAGRDLDHAEAGLAELLRAAAPFNESAVREAQVATEQLRQRRDILQARVAAVTNSEERLAAQRGELLEAVRRTELRRQADAYERDLQEANAEFLAAIRAAHASIPAEMRPLVGGWGWLYGAAAGATGYIPRIIQLANTENLLRGAGISVSSAAPYREGFIGQLISSGELDIT